jgi:hypothetical protein
MLVTYRVLVFDLNTLNVVNVNFILNPHGIEKKVTMFYTGIPHCAVNWFQETEH